MARGMDLLERYSEFDPGGVRVVRGLHLAAALALGLGAGYLLATQGLAWLDQLIGTWVRREWPAYAGAFSAPKRVFAISAIAAMLAAHIVLLVPAGERRTEFKNALQIAGVGVGFLLLIGLAAPGTWGFGVLTLHLIWIAVIGGGLYIRRYGPAGMRIGTALILLTMFAVLIDPDRGLGLWFPVAGAVGALAGLFVRFATWRPSPVRVFRSRIIRFREVAAENLAEIAQDLKFGTRPRRPSMTLRGRWFALAKAMEVASAERPSKADRYAHYVATAYRVVLAGEAVTDALSEISDTAVASRFVRERIAGALSELSERLSRFAGGDTAPDPALVDSLHAAQDDLIKNQTLDSPTKVQLMRLLTGVIRVAMALNTVEVRNEPADRPPAVSSGGKGSAAMGFRLGLQGIVAASITTGLNYAFHFQHAYWATLTVALVLTGTVGETVARTVRRALGTAVGVLVAIAVFPLISASPATELTLIFIAMMAAVMVIDIRYAVASGLIGFLVVLGLHMIEGVGAPVMLSRAYETFLGAGVALAVAWTVAPAFSGNRLATDVQAFIGRCHSVFRRAAAQPTIGVDHTAALEADASAIRAQLPSLQAERLFARGGSAALSEVTVLMEALVMYLGLFERASAVTAREGAGPAKAVLDELDQVVEATFDAAFDPKKEAPALDPVLARFTEAVPLDGSIPAEQASAIVERFYYGRKIGQTLAEFKTTWARVN
ncbi:FUSC family protein [Amorphus sp. 3PC139-8]|uniref:FUSC family protein n=1 Tax=Amorphus sp. 3PC139-8 TaxID=2735676 RepID=UPI00345D512F